MKNYRFLLSGKWVGAFVLCIFASIICMYLADWQMGRKEALDYKNNLIVENFDAEPVVLDQISGAFVEELPDAQWKPLKLSGSYLPEHQLLVRNRPYNGLNGYEVLVPFQIENGPVVVINRGWMEAGFGDASKTAREVPAPPAGEVTVIARLHNGEADTGRGAPEGQISSIALGRVADLTGLDVATGGYGLLAEEDPAAASAPIIKDKPDLDTGPNLSYAVQWYVFALMSYLVYFWSARQKVRNDEIDAQVAAELDQYYQTFYDEQGRYIGEVDEEVVLRKMAMVDDMPAHMKSIVRPKLAKKRSYATDEEIEDAYLDELEDYR